MCRPPSCHEIQEEEKAFPGFRIGCADQAAAATWSIKVVGFNVESGDVDPLLVAELVTEIDGSTRW